ncbi:MAG: hypothetical protein ACK55Z_07425, partial [bacterium]
MFQATSCWALSPRTTSDCSNGSRALEGVCSPGSGAASTLKYAWMSCSLSPRTQTPDRVTRRSRRGVAPSSSAVYVSCA